MAKTRINCPNCRQPLVAEVEQLFDVGVDPSAKQKLLSGAVNVVACQNCGYQGGVSTPLVYHDPDKELLLTFMPPELGLPVNEQERILGGMINQVVNKLPQEKRKGYLLRPQPTLTMQGLVERVLEGEGITREMIQAQQQRLALIQRLLGITSQDVLTEVAKQEDKLIDNEFFSLLNRLAETAMMSGDQQSARAVAELQRSLLPITTFGRKLQEQSQEVEAALSALRQLGPEMTRENLLELVIKAPSETRLRAFASLARPVMDYQFFQALSERIERGRGDGRTRLVEIRQKLLEYTREIDQQLEERRKAMQRGIDQILQAPDIEAAMGGNLDAVDEMFMEELELALQAARKQGDLDRSSKLQKMLAVIEQASAPPLELKIVEALIDAPDEAAMQAILEANAEMVTPQFLEALSNVLAQVESTGDEVLIQKIRMANRQAVRYSMRANLRK